MITLSKLALALAVVVATGCGIGQSPEERALARADSLLDDVDATEVQRAKIRAAVTDLTKSFADNRVARGTAKGAFLAQLEAPRADSAVVTAEADRMTASLAKNAHAVVDTGAVIHATLTPEQRQILTDKAKPGRGMKAAWFVAGRMGYGPPVDAAEGRERAAARLEKGFDSIAATEAQREALRPLAAGLVDEALPLLDERDVIVTAFTTAWTSERPDVASLHALVDTEVKKLNEVARSGADAFVEAHAILTPAQRKDLGTKLASSGGCDG